MLRYLIILLSILKTSAYLRPISYHFPSTWNHIKRHRMRLYLNHYTSSTSLLEEPQEDANPDTWSAAYAKPDPNADKGGGDEPEVNYDYETNGNNGGTSIDPAQAECTKKTGMYLQSCVYISNQRLDKNKKDGCKSNIASIGAACVFGPVKL